MTRSFKRQTPHGREETGDEANTLRRSVLIAHKREADEHIVLQQVQKLLQACSVARIRFKDESFPASAYSLYVNGQSLVKATLALLPDQQQQRTSQTGSSTDIIQWLRPDQIRPEPSTDNDRTQWAVFRNPRPNDVLQGALGDCWFITALSVLAEEPEYLTRVNRLDESVSHSCISRLEY